VRSTASPFVAAAQPRTKTWRIGYLGPGSPSAGVRLLESFRQGLRELGYVEGQNLVIEYRHEGGGFGRLPELAAELVRQKPDVLVAVTTNAALAMRRATTTIPIVFMGVTDPVTAGLVESLSRPGGNTTGITNIAAILTGKRLELLKETLPRLSRVAVLWDPQAPGSVPQWQESQLRARELVGLQLTGPVTVPDWLAPPARPATPRLPVRSVSPAFFTPSSER
jgi:putative ABC transport system substrate-binding protein